MGAFLNSPLLRGFLKRFFGRWCSMTDNQLIGLRGRVISGRVTTTFGTVRVASPNGSELTVSCRVREGDDVPFKGDMVLLVGYDLREEIFDVRKDDSPELV